jgi:hypothetical protein
MIIVSVCGAIIRLGFVVRFAIATRMTWCDAQQMSPGSVFHENVDRPVTLFSGHWAAHASTSAVGRYAQCSVMFSPGTPSGCRSRECWRCRHPVSSSATHNVCFRAGRYAGRTVEARSGRRRLDDGRARWHVFLSAEVFPSARLSDPCALGLLARQRVLMLRGAASAGFLRGWRLEGLQDYG